MSKMKGSVIEIDYQTAVSFLLPKHYTREEAKKRLMDIGVMDENENLIPPYDEIFIKKEKNDG